MVVMDADGVVRKRNEDLGDDRRLYLLRDSPPASDTRVLDVRDRNDRVGSIEVLKAGRARANESPGPARTSILELDDDLAAARGIAASIVLGLGLWLLAAGLLGIFFI